MMQTINDKTTEIFGEIVLVAADIDYNAFEKGEAYNRLIDMGKRIHIYYSKNDHILDFSKFTKNLNSRLGKYGRYRVDETLHDVYDIEVTHCEDDIQYQSFVDKFGRHWYYYTSTTVANDIIQVLKGEKSNFLKQNN
jgi:esterase/lipase superfamily enzyme